MPDLSDMGLSGGLKGLTDALNSVKGYNNHLDGVVDFVISMVNKFTVENINYSQLIESLTYNDSTETLRIVINGDILGTNDIILQLNSVDNINIDIESLKMGSVTVNLNASVTANAHSVTANAQDYTTNLVIRLDSVNTIYANIDALNGIIRLRLGELYLQYSDNKVYLNYKDVAIKGDVGELCTMIEKLAELANQRLVDAGLVATMVDFGSMFDIDIRQILDSVKITQNGSNFSVSAEIFGMTIDGELRGGQYPTFNNLTLSLLGKDITVNTEEITRQYIDFGSVKNFVTMEEIFEDYYPILEDLVTADGWHFDLEAEFNVDGTVYRIAKGSSIDFLYSNIDDFSFKAKLLIQQGASNQNFMDITLLLLNKRLFIDYNGLKLTISQQALIDTFDLYEEVLRVVPQLQVLIDQMLGIMTEAGENSQNLDLSNILTSANYNNGVLTLQINGGLLVNKLGIVTMQVGAYDDSLYLALNNVKFDNINLTRLKLTVQGKAIKESQNLIGTANGNHYINLDSLYQLTSAFVQTADKNSFHLQGSVTVDIVIKKVSVGFDLYVDIDSQGFVYVAVKISRAKLSIFDLANIVYEDYGGNGYIYYNGKTNNITVKRDSYRRKTIFHSAKLNYSEYYKSMTPNEFCDNIAGYMLDLISFKSFFRNLILDAIEDSGKKDTPAIKDIWTGYSYTRYKNSGEFAVNVNMKALDNNLGKANIKISHDNNYNLTSLSGNMSLLWGICDIGFNINNLTSQYGKSMNYVSSTASW